MSEPEKIIEKLKPEKIIEKLKETLDVPVVYFLPTMILILLAVQLATWWDMQNRFERVSEANHILMMRAAQEQEEFDKKTQEILDDLRLHIQKDELFQTEQKGCRE